VKEVYSDDEIERMYLGIPFEDSAPVQKEEIAFADEEIKNFFLGLPLMRVLVNLTLSVAA
jgi:hypothetical protein